ncbi:MAG: 50S ribosome-binding GTPase [Desulfurococcales archaeon]|nr:50S ribosome-binding GTPase [Desulfurococcales archaeon]
MNEITETITPPEKAKHIQVPEYKELLTRMKRRYEKVGRNLPILEMELARLQMIADTIESKTSFVKELYRLLKNLHPFYRSLLFLEFDENKVQKYIECVFKARKLAQYFAKKYRYILMAQEDRKAIKKKASEARGRMLSPIKRCSKGLIYLKNLVVYLSHLPGINPLLPTIIVAGPPSVGKSSFVASASRARIDVAEYPFTTKEIHVGHTTINEKDIQLIDTPGLLDRKLEERNEIELKAITALKHLKGVIVFLLDPTETSSYPIPVQLEIAEDIKNITGNKPFVYVISKIDLISPKTLSNTIELIKAKTGNTPYTVKANDSHSVRELLQEITDNYLGERYSSV